MPHYAESLLASGERIIRVHRQHWITMLDESKLAILGLVIAIVLFLFKVTANVTGVLSDLLGLITLVLLIVGIARIVWSYLRWSTNEYVLTNRRVMQVSGVVNKRTSDSSLEKINDAILTQAWIGRMLHFGDLEILTASESGIELMHMLVDAAGFKRGMLDAKHELELEVSRGGMPSPPLRAAGPMVATTRQESRTPGLVRGDASDADLDRADRGGGATVESARRVGARPGTPNGDATSGPPRTEPGVPTPPPAGHQMTSDEVTTTLGRLADLRDRGAITPEEFEAKKRELLARL